MKKNLILAVSLALFCAGCVIVVVEPKPDQKTTKMTCASTNMCSMTTTNRSCMMNSAAAH